MLALYDNEFGIVAERACNCCRVSQLPAGRERPHIVGASSGRVPSARHLHGHVTELGRNTFPVAQLFVDLEALLVQANSSSEISLLVGKDRGVPCDPRPLACRRICRSQIQNLFEAVAAFEEKLPALP